MNIELPQYLSECERLEYIKILHKLENITSKYNGEYWSGFRDCLKYTEMFLSGAIKKISYGTN